MSCHPSDPRNPVSDKAKLAGYKEANSDAPIRECAGALILVQRELMRWQAVALSVPKGKAMRAYREISPKGLTQDGLAEVISRSIFRGTPMGSVPMTAVNLNDPVGCETLEWNTQIASETFAAVQNATKQETYDEASPT